MTRENKNMEYEIIKIDTFFPDFRTKELKTKLQDGWIIIDKTLLKDRYIHYVLGKNIDSDIGKCSYETGTTSH